MCIISYMFIKGMQYNVNMTDNKATYVRTYSEQRNACTVYGKFPSVVCLALDLESADCAVRGLFGERRTSLEV